MFDSGGFTPIRSFAKNTVQLQKNDFLSSWCLSLFQNDSKSTKPCDESIESSDSEDSPSSQISLPAESQNSDPTEDLDSSTLVLTVETNPLQPEENNAAKTDTPNENSAKDVPLADTQPKEQTWRSSGPVQQSIIKHIHVISDIFQNDAALPDVHSTKKRPTQNTIISLFASQKSTLATAEPQPIISTETSIPKNNSSSSTPASENSQLPSTCSASSTAAVALNQFESLPQDEIQTVAPSSTTENAAHKPVNNPSIVTVSDVQQVASSSSCCKGKLRLPEKTKKTRKSKRKKEATEPEEKSARQKMMEKLKERNISQEEIDNLFAVAGFHIPNDMNAEEAEKQRRIHQKKLDLQLNRELEHPLMKPSYVNQHYNLDKLDKYVQETMACGTHNPYYGISPFNHVLEEKFPESIMIFLDYSFKIVTRHVDEHVTWAKDKRIPWKTMLRGSKDMQSHVLQYIRFCYEMSGEAPVLDTFVCEIRLTLFIRCMEKFGKRYNTVANHAKSLETVSFFFFSLSFSSAKFLSSFSSTHKKRRSSRTMFTIFPTSKLQGSTLGN